MKMERTNLNNIDKLAVLKKLGQPIQERYMVSEERPRAFDDMGKQIQMYTKIVEAYKTKVPLPLYTQGTAAQKHTPNPSPTKTTVKQAVDAL